MCRTVHASQRLALGVFLLTTAGCADPGKTAETDLMRIGMAYHKYCNRMFLGPKNADDFQSYLEATPDTYASLKAGRYVLIWKVDRDQAKKTAAKGGPPLADQVLGYEADVSTSGGKVLMVDGSVKTLSAAEFQAAPKAEPKK